jgi:hypothetical protein
VENRSRSTLIPSSRSLAWIRSPWFDCFCLANVCWPLILLPGMSSQGETAVDFWQIYFLTLPHRWLTLFLVALDPDRRANRLFLLVSLAISFAAVVSVVFVGSEAFLCLGVIDYLWNGWHFASQHSGVLRIYSKKSGGGIPSLERWGIRLMITYVILRTANRMIYSSWIPEIPADVFDGLDAFVLLLAVGLIWSNVTPWSLQRLPKLIYLLSVLSLYLGYLLSFRASSTNWILCFATAASMFHAVEYIGIVSHYAMRRKTSGSAGWMRVISVYWPLILVCFILLLGSFSLWVNSWSVELATMWQGLNLWAAFTHYAWDGMIWKLRRSETSQALGVS